MRRGGGRRDDGGYGGGGELSNTAITHPAFYDCVETAPNQKFAGYDRRDGPYSRGGGGGYGNHARDNYGQFSFQSKNIILPSLKAFSHYLL